MGERTSSSTVQWAPIRPVLAIAYRHSHLLAVTANGSLGAEAWGGNHAKKDLV